MRLWICFSNHKNTIHFSNCSEGIALIRPWGGGGCGVIVLFSQHSSQPLFACLPPLRSHLRQFSSSLLSEQSSSSSHLQMVGIHLLLLHWNCPSSHSSEAATRKHTHTHTHTEGPDGWETSPHVVATSSTVICKWMPNWYSAFIQVNWLSPFQRHALFWFLFFFQLLIQFYFRI